MSWLKDKITSLVVDNLVGKVAAWLTGKKTIIGAISLLLWAVIYASPIVFPQYGWIVPLATHVRDALQSAGVNLDTSLFSTGVGFTVVGLIDKLRRMFKKD